MKYLFLLLSLFASLAFAQRVPNGGTITQGQIWTPAQWMAAWASKADFGSFLILLGATYTITPTTLTVTGASGDGTTATLTFTSAAAPPVGATIVVSGVSPSDYNGAFTITSSTAVSVSYGSTAVDTYASGGSVIYAIMSPDGATSNVVCPSTGSTPVTLPVAHTDGVLFKISNPSSGACTLYTRNSQAIVGAGATGTSGIIPAYTNVDVWVVYNGGTLQYSVK
jgi:hypothetical protein